MNENIHKMILDRDVEIDKLKDRLLATNIENERLREAVKSSIKSLEASGLCFDHPTIVHLEKALKRTEGGD